MDTIFMDDPFTGTVRVACTVPNAVSGFQLVWLQFNYTMDDAFDPSMTQSDFELLLYHRFTKKIGKLLPSTSDPFLQYTFRMPSSDLKRGGARMDTSASPFAYVRQPMNGICLKLNTATGGRRYTGRMHWPFLVDADYTDSRVNSTFFDRIALLVNLLTEPWPVPGTLLYPVVWSRADGFYDTITDVVPCEATTWLRKRRSGIYRYHAPIPWDEVW